MRQYEECYVAFMDILGFKQLIINGECEKIYQIFSEIHLRSKASMNYNGVQIKAYECIQHRILSDSIIVFINAEIEDSFPALIDVCTRLQRCLANRDNPILLRGGITKGPLYYEDDIIFGQGLTNAYLLESNLAKYPRVIFTGNTLEDGKKITKYMFPEIEGFLKNFMQDEDALYYIDYLPTMCGWTLEQIKEYCDRLKSLCNKMLNVITDAALREKYLWLKKNVDKSVNCMEQIREMYRKEKEEETNAKFEDYNARFSVYEKD